MRRKLTPEQAADRVDRRKAAREAALAKVAEIRAWRDGRRAAADERAADRRRERKRAIRQALQDGEQPRGVDRVPEAQRDLYVTVEPYRLGKRGTVLADPQDRHPAGNYATRRARGQRGKPRRPRRRELPGAVERRLERRRQEWAS